ncbi:MAG: vitamin K epoxide reductase family protein [Thermosulfidibacteraceae bacterium]
MRLEGIKAGENGGVRKFINIVFSIVGLFVVLVDFLLAKKSGVGICHAESCRVVSQSSFSHVLGVPLTAFGILYFLALLILSFSRGLFYLFLTIGAGASFYLLFVQFFVIGNVCTFCVLVELIIISLLLINFRNLKNTLFMIFFSFVFFHALYTFPPMEERFRESNFVKAFQWKGNGTLEGSFYFDPFCSHCGKAYEILKNSRVLFKEVNFKPILISPKGMKNLIRFYKLSLVEGPWIAFERTHRVEDLKGDFDPLLMAKIRMLVKKDLRDLESLGINGVPVVIVRNDDNGVSVVLEGVGAIESYLSKKRGMIPREDRSKPLLHINKGQVGLGYNGTKEPTPGVTSNATGGPIGDNHRKVPIDLKDNENKNVCTPTKNCTE